MTDWPAILQAFNGQFTQEPTHLAPSVVFKQDLNKKNALCYLSHYAFLSVQGLDAQKFLQGQLTCDMRDISLSQTKLAGHCNPKGRLHGIFQVIQLKSDHYLLAIPNVQIAHIQASLKKYAVFSKVKITQLMLYSFGLVGTEEDIQKINPELSQLSFFQKQDSLSLNLDPICYIRMPSHDAGLYRFLVLFHGQADTQSIINYLLNLNTLGFDNISTTYWHKLSLLALLPNIYPETTEKCLPHTLNLPQLGAVSFNKGCYTGQEIVARMEYLGKIKKTIICREFKWDNHNSSPLPLLGQNNNINNNINNNTDNILLDYIALPNLYYYLGLFISDVT